MHGLREFRTNRIVSGGARERQLSVDWRSNCGFDGSDFRTGGHVLQSGRLGFTEGPSIAVK
jgi:hypothetical protein